MCLKTKIQQTLAEIAEKQERLIKLEKLESETAPVKNLLIALLADYSQAAPEELADFWQEVLAIGQQHGLAVQPLALDELRQWEATNAENERLRRELERELETEKYNQTLVAIDKQLNREVEDLRSQLVQQPEIQREEAIAVEPEYEPEEAYDTVESILRSHGFFMPDLKVSDCYDSKDKYEDYQGWAIYYTVTDKAGVTSTGELKNQITDIGLDHPGEGFWTADADMIGEDDPTFPKNFTDHDGIVAWTRGVIDEIVPLLPPNLIEHTPGQLALDLEFPEPTAEQIEEELALDDEPEPAQQELTDLQKLLVSNSNFTFEDLGVSVAVESVFTEQEIEIDGSEDEDDEDAPATEEIEEALFTCCNAEGRIKEYYHDAEQLVRGFQSCPTIVRFNAEQYAKQFLRDLPNNAKIKEKIARWNADKTLLSNRPPSSQSIKSELAKSEPDATNIGFRFQYQKFETMDFQVQVYPQYANGANFVAATFRFLDADNKFVFDRSLMKSELGDLTCKIVAEQLIMDYQAKETARLERIANPHAKEEDKFVELIKFGLNPDIGYLKRKDNEDNGEILATYIAFANQDAMGKKTATLAKSRAKKWVYFLRNSYGSCGWVVSEPREVKRMQNKPGVRQFAYEVKITGASFGQIQKLSEEDFSLLPLEMEEKQNRTELQSLELKSDSGNNEISATEDAITKESLTDNEIQIVELIRAALSKFNAEAVREINLTEVPELVRNKVWNALSEQEQKTYELLLKLEFTQAPDFSVQTLEFITSIDGKQGKSVFLSLRSIDGVSSRVWRYQGQIGDGGYSCKEAAAVAAWLQ